LLCLLIIAGIVFAVYLIVAAYNLIKTLQHSQKVLADFEIVSHIASERTQQLDKLIEQTSKKIKSGQGVLNVLPAIIKAISQIAKAAQKKSAGGASGAGKGDAGKNKKN
jgi:hypothetical protein